ncbi:hypothetical protein EJP77_00255 [Paenibacillus zeisoli]|uniref:SbsC C-terminal domain-containing protein n=1 Tax=Paenibacillus zeisoli TaxID=2496267 RepID=A0A3S1D2I9_9BACL|nr:hypothetical protein [Paenibacillus zeisoli]RUT35499.1 hypothetical protein EJP77_00255 [Paenibacillus zeisoli]
MNGLHVKNDSLRKVLLLSLSAALTAGITVASFSPSAAAGAQTASTVTAKSSNDVYLVYESYIKKPSKLAAARQYLLKNISKVKAYPAMIMTLHLENAQRAQLEASSAKLYPSNVQKALDTAYRQKKDLSYKTLLSLIKDSKIRSILTEARDKGYKVATGEGMYFLTMDYEGFKPFKPYVTKDIAAYIDIMATQTNQPAFSDAAVVISWDELIKRTLALENFVKSYPKSNRTKAVKLEYEGMKFNVFYGSSNTPVYNENSKNEFTTLLPKVRKAYEAAVQKGTADSQLLITIKQVLKLLDSNEGKWSKELDRYLKKQIEV